MGLSLQRVTATGGAGFIAAELLAHGWRVGVLDSLIPQVADGAAVLLEAMVRWVRASAAIDRGAVMKKEFEAMGLVS